VCRASIGPPVSETEPINLLWSRYVITRRTLCSCCIASPPAPHSLNSIDRIHYAARRPPLWTFRTGPFPLCAAYRIIAEPAQHTQETGHLRLSVYIVLCICDALTVGPVRAVPFDNKDTFLALTYAAFRIVCLAEPARTLPPEVFDTLPCLGPSAIVHALYTFPAPVSRFFRLCHTRRPCAVCFFREWNNL
jgi:hypothetical protein